MLNTIIMEEYNNQSVRIEVGTLINQGWELTKKHFPAFLLVMILGCMVSSLYEVACYGPYLGTVLNYGPDVTEEQMIELLIENGEIWNWVGWIMVAAVISFFVGYYLSIITYRMLNTAIKGEKIDLTAEFKNAFRGYWFFLGAYLVYSIIIVMGMICCILPGIYLAIRLMFTPMIAANHPEVAFSDAFSRSWQMTKGHFWILLWLGIVVIGINIIGLICCCVGLIVTSILSYMMYACVYKVLTPVDNSATEETALIETME